MKTEGNLSLVQYVECTETSDTMREVLAYVCSWWNTSKGADYTTTKEGKVEVPKVGERAGIELLSSIAERVSVARDDYPIIRLMYPKHGTQQWLYVYRFSLDFEKAF